MRKLFIFLGLAVISTAAFVAAPKGNTEHSTSSITAPKDGTAQAATLLQDPPGTIDGAITPELIPDDVAYSLFFNFLAGRGTEKEKNSLRAYMQQVQLGDIDLEALISTSQEYQNALNNIDTQQSALARANHQDLRGIETQLNELQQRRLVLLNEKVQSLPNRLGKTGAANIQRHVMEYIKRKVKIIPGPMTPEMAH